MVTVIPGQKVLASHVNEKLVKTGDELSGNITTTAGVTIGTAGNTTFVGALVGGSAPAVNGGEDLGTSTEGFSKLYLKDTANSNVYKVEVISGVLTATLIP